MSKRSFRAFFIALLFLPLALEPAMAQAKNKPKPAAKPVAATPAAPKVAIPQSGTLNILIRLAIITLNNANWTGNYTVLRDVAAPSLKKNNSAAKLGEIFANLRKRKIDLSPILLVNPKLYQQPSIGKNGLLRLSGFFPLKPEQVNFDLLYQNVGSGWALFGISVNVGNPKQANTAPKPDAKPKQKTAGKSKGKTKVESKTKPNSAKIKNAQIPVPQQRPKKETAEATPAPKKAEEKKSSVWPF